MLAHIRFGSIASYTSNSSLHGILYMRLFSSRWTFAESLSIQPKYSLDVQRVDFRQLRTDLWSQAPPDETKQRKNKKRTKRQQAT